MEAVTSPAAESTSTSVSAVPSPATEPTCAAGAALPVDETPSDCCRWAGIPRLTVLLTITKQPFSDLLQWRAA